MKLILVVLAVLLCGDIAAHFVPSVHAQGAVTNSPYAFSPLATHATCPTPTAGATWFCFGTDGAYQSINGAAYAQIGVSAPGVTSFNGRTGDVLAKAGDYSYSQLSAPPTSLSGCNASLSTSGTTAGTSGSLSAQGCVIK